MSIYTVIASIFFLFHIIFETLASFVKYNFSSLGKHMTGASLSNMLAISSRGCVAIYGVSIAVVIEKNLADMSTYGYTFALVMFIGASFSLFASKLKISTHGYELIRHDPKSIFRHAKFIFLKNDENCLESFNKFLAVMMGTQFIAVVLAYGLCFTLPKYRLLIISMVPVVSMLGTLTTIFFIEPKLAKKIDADNKAGYSASKEFLHARATSFFFCALLLLILPLIIKNQAF